MFPAFASKSCLGLAHAEEDEAPVAELNSTTRMLNGWRISFVKANATMSSSLPQGLRHRPSDQRMEGALKSQAHRKTCRERLRLGLTKAPEAPEPKAPEPEAPRPRFEIGGSSSSTA